MQTLKNISKVLFGALLLSLVFQLVTPLDGEASITIRTYKDTACKNDVGSNQDMSLIDTNVVDEMDVDIDGRSVDVPLATVLDTVKLQFQRWVDGFRNSGDPTFASNNGVRVCLGSYNDAVNPNSAFIQKKHHHIVFGKKLLGLVFDKAQADAGFSDMLAIKYVAGHEFVHSLQIRTGQKSYFTLSNSDKAVISQGLSATAAAEAINNKEIELRVQEELHAECMTGYLMQLHELSKLQVSSPIQLLNSTLQDLDTSLDGARQLKGQNLMSSQPRVDAMMVGISAVKSKLNNEFTTKTRRSIKTGDVLKACEGFRPAK